MQNYNCKNCGAVLFWDPKSNCLKCDFCESEYQITDFEDNTMTEEIVKDEALDNDYVATEVSDDMVVYACKTCGGEVVALKTTMATICPYCGEAISITSKSVGEFRPELVIPFARTKKEIMELYKKYVSGSFLTPKIFKDEHIIEKIQGVFVPFHLHTIQNRANYEFKGETSSSSRVGYDKVTTHKVYSLKIKSRGKYNRIPTDASKNIDNALMDSLEPFSYKEIQSYNPAYMAGFVAEQLDEDEQVMKNRAAKRCFQAMEAKSKNEFSSYENITTVHNENDIEQHHAEYTMLPVWMLNVKHLDKKYLFAVNGQSGKVVGKLPIDKLKLILVGIGSFIVSDLVVALLITLLA